MCRTSHCLSSCAPFAKRCTYLVKGGRPRGWWFTRASPSLREGRVAETTFRNMHGSKPRPWIQNERKLPLPRNFPSVPFFVRLVPDLLLTLGFLFRLYWSLLSWRLRILSHMGSLGGRIIRLLVNWYPSLSWSAVTFRLSYCGINKINFCWFEGDFILNDFILILFYLFIIFRVQYESNIRRSRISTGLIFYFLKTNDLIP